MKAIPRKTLSLLMAFLLLAALSCPALASVAIGDDLTSFDTVLNQSTQLSKNVFWSNSHSEYQTENYITYTPNTTVTPIVTYGDTMTSRSTVSAAAKTLESQGYRVVAGINGDFFNLSNGLPAGLVVSSGEVKASDGGLYAIGFHADGTAVIGKPALKMTADLGYTDANGSEEYRTVYGINRNREDTGGLFLYTYEFNSHHTTGNTTPGVDLLCNITGGSLAIGGKLELEAVSVIEDNSTVTATSIGYNQVVLSASSQLPSYFVDALKQVVPGSALSVSITASDSQWNGIQYGIGALYSIVQNGSIVSSGLVSGTNPYTAVGLRPDGSLILYTIDGRQDGYSYGVTMRQVAARLIELGCTTAVCMDGGGSTTLTITEPSATTAKTINMPSEGSERAVSDHIFLVASNQPTGELGHFYVTTDESYVLSGSTVSVTTAALDTNYIPMTAPDYTLSVSAGTLNGNVLTTPLEGGDITVTAADTVTGISGSTVVHAIAKPDSIALASNGSWISSLTVSAGSTTAITAVASWHRQQINSGNHLYSWYLSGDIGAVDNSGNFHAYASGSGTLTVSAGGTSVSIPITVTGTLPLSALETFENGTGSFAAANKTTVNVTTARDYVRYGAAALQIKYESGGAVSLSDTLPDPYNSVTVWVYGDSSGNTLNLQTSNGETVPLGTLNFSGWQQLTASLPQNVTITGLTFTGDSGGTIYLDQLVATMNGQTDSEVPAVTAYISGDKVYGQVTDVADGVLPATSITLTKDGTEIAFDYDSSTGKMSAPLNIGDSAGHRFTITAVDASGNIGRASADLTASNTSHLFSDINGYWAASYVDWLKTAGITNGYSDGSFRPNQNISRQEFTVMLYRYLKLDASQYNNVELPFADLDEISDYALEAVRALYSEGIVTGSTGTDGSLYFLPYNSLTRAQAAAMIGRTQDKGYAVGTQTFTDSNSIPNYAKSYIQSMAAQGIISGYTDGSFRSGTYINRGQMAKILYNLT